MPEYCFISATGFITFLNATCLFYDVHLFYMYLVHSCC